MTQVCSSLSFIDPFNGLGQCCMPFCYWTVGCTGVRYHAGWLHNRTVQSGVHLPGWLCQPAGVTCAWRGKEQSLPMYTCTFTNNIGKLQQTGGNITTQASVANVACSCYCSPVHTIRSANRMQAAISPTRVKAPALTVAYWWTVLVPSLATVLNQA